MNTYNSDTIYLSQESAKSLLSSLTHSTAANLRRDEFLGDVPDRIILCTEDNSITIDIPEIPELESSVIVESEKYNVSPKIDIVVATGQVQICPSTILANGEYYKKIKVELFNTSCQINSTKYNPQKTNSLYNNECVIAKNPAA